ncbi:hypothetical protein CPT_Machias_123 [Staphylococcus phage Machias]|nr:hypothetical protein CPT_Machias_123 [Staphylococcus phage Machias]
MEGYDFDLYITNRDLKDNHFMKINKDRYNNDRDYIERVNTINMIKLLTHVSYPDYENIISFNVDCKLKLRGFNDYKDIKLSYYQEVESKSTIIAGISFVKTELNLISKEKDNRYLTDELLYEYDMMKINTSINNKLNTIKLTKNEATALNSISQRSPKFHLSLDKFRREFLKMITELNKYEDIQFLIDGTYYSLEDINLYNKDLFRTATDKEFKNYLVKEGFR